MTELGNLALARSTQLLEESRGYLAGGVASTLRLAVRPAPLFVSHGAGSRIVDVDGNEYVDYTMAYGPLILGHAHPAVVDAVTEASRRGTTFGAQHEGEVELARRIVEAVPSAELVALSGSGTEAVMLALRLARAVTGRRKVIRFEGHYHGWSDTIYTGDGLSDEGGTHPGTGGQSPAALEDVHVAPWNDLDALRSTLERLGPEVAAVICEPVVCNSGCLIPWPGYLEELRLLTREHGCLLVFDEVITGFRLALGGAQARFGIDADLAVYGKAVAGGLPLSAVAGRRDVLELVATGEVGHLGTLNGNTACVAAAVATLTELARDEGAAFAHMGRLGERLATGLAEAAEAAGVPLAVNAAGAVFFTIFTELPEVRRYDAFQQRNVERGARFAELMLAEGVYVRPNGLWYVSATHTDEDVDRTLAAARAVFPRLAGERA